MNEPARWYVAVNGERIGPLTLEQVVLDAARGDINEQDLVWKDGMTDWVPLLSVREVDDALLAAGVHLPAGGYVAKDPGQNASLRAVLPVGRTVLAIAAGYLGLFGMFIPPIAPITIIVSLLAIRDLKKRPQMHGMGRAVFGLVAGVIGIAFGVVLLVSMK